MNLNSGNLHSIVCPFLNQPPKTFFLHAHAYTHPRTHLNIHSSPQFNVNQLLCFINISRDILCLFWVYVKSCRSTDWILRPNHSWWVIYKQLIYSNNKIIISLCWFRRLWVHRGHRISVRQMWFYEPQLNYNGQMYGYVWILAWIFQLYKFEVVV